MNGFPQDVRFAFRMLAKAPVFTAIAVATLALAIGANTAILSVGTSVLYRTLPYKNPDRIAVIWSKDTKRGWDHMQTSVPALLEYRKQATSLAHVTGYTWTDYENFSLGGSDGARRVRGVAILPGLFDALETRPLLGRDFLPQEFVRDAHVAILGYDLWRTHFSSDPSLVGRTIRINREPYTVVAILPANFEVPVLDAGLELLVPFALDGPDAADHASRLMIGVGVLKPGRTLEQAGAELQAISKHLGDENPDEKRFTASVQTVRDSEGLQDARAQLPIYLTTVVLMMLIAASNVTGILLSRFTGRGSELVVRSALGASRRRLIRQLLTESVILSGLAGALALIVAGWVGSLLISYRPFYMPSVPERVLGGLAIGAIVLLSIFIGIVFGLFPALSVARNNLHQSMNRVSSRVGSGWWHDGLRNALIGAEVAIAVTLIVGAGLMIRTVARIARVDVGFEPRSLTVGRVALDPKHYPSSSNQIAFYSALLEKLRTQPAVVSATAASHFCNYDPSGWCMGADVRVPGRPVSEYKMGGSETAVMPGFFAAIGMPIIRGRDFTDHEGEPVIVIDETFARTFFSGEDPIGKQVELVSTAQRTGDSVLPGLRTIIGVVPPVNRIAYWAKPFPQAYLPFSQNPVPAMYAVVRTRDGSGSDAIRRSVAELDPELPVFWSATVEGWIRKFYASQRFELLALGSFAVVSLLIAGSGLYAVISYRVTQRTRELGIRLALGARRRDLKAVVMWQAGLVIAAGMVAGLAGAIAIGSVLSKFLFGVRPRDPVTVIAGTAVVLLISLLAAYLPARRASNLDPLVALRAE